MVGMTSAEIITDAGHCSTLHIMNMAISSHCHVPMLGLAERFYKPSITQHTVDINIIIFLCYTLPKQQLPRVDRCTATSNSGKQHPAIQTSYFAQNPAQINELYRSNWHVPQQTTHIIMNTNKIKTTTKNKKTKKRNDQPIKDETVMDKFMVPRISFRSLVVKAYPHRKSIRTTLCEHIRGMQAGSRREKQQFVFVRCVSMWSSSTRPRT